MSENKKNVMLGSAAVIFLLLLLNKGLGFVKSITIASVFGANIQTDVYYVAEGLMQNVLIPVTEAVAVSFLPVYIGIKEKNKEEAKKFASRTLMDVFLLAFVLSGALYFAAPVLLRLFLPSYTTEEIEMVLSYYRILIWGMCFYMSNSLFQSLLNAEKVYGYFTFTAMLNNLILTAAVMLLGRKYGLTVMAAAVPFSYFVQFVFLQVKSQRYGKLTVRYAFGDSRIKMLCLKACPIFFGNAIWELNQLVDRSLLSSMVVGSVTAVSYAAVLYQFASNLINIPITTVIYTELAEAFVAGHMEEGAMKLKRGIDISLFLCIPMSFFVVNTAELVVRITYGRGAFDEAAVFMTGQGLRYYGLCFLAFCLNGLLFRACYSLGDTLLPMKVGIGTVSMNIVLSICLSRPLGLRGIVLATAISTSLTCLITMYIFHRTKVRLQLRSFVKSGGRAVLVSVVAAVVIWGLLHLTPIENGFFLFVLAAVLYFGIYGILMFLLKDGVCMEFVGMIQPLVKRFMRKQ